MAVTEGGFVRHFCQGGCLQLHEHGVDPISVFGGGGGVVAMVIVGVTVMETVTGG